LSSDGDVSSSSELGDLASKHQINEKEPVVTAKSLLDKGRGASRVVCGFHLPLLGKATAMEGVKFSSAPDLSHLVNEGLDSAHELPKKSSADSSSRGATNLA